MHALLVSLLDRIDSWALAQLWQVSLLAVVVGLLVRVACRHRPHLAYLLWMMVVIKCLTPPVVSSPTSPFSWIDRSVEAGAPSTSTAMAPLATLPRAESGTAKEAEVRAEDPMQVVAIVSPLSTFSSVATGLMTAWFAGIVVFSFVLVIKWISLRRMLRTAIEPSSNTSDLLEELASRLNMRRKVRLVVLREEVRPAVCGAIYPTIILPAALAESASRGILEPVLAHELIHVRRGDTVASVLQLMAQVLWWFHPLVWWVNREARRERERACDEAVVTGLECSASGYARVLVDLLESFHQGPHTFGAASVTMLSFTTRRLEHLTRGAKGFHQRTPRGYWVIAIVGLLVVLPGAGLRWNVRTVNAAPKVTGAEAKGPDSKQEGADGASAKPNSWVPSDGTVTITAEYQADDDVASSFPLSVQPESTEANTEEHRRAVAEIKKLGGVVTRQQRANGKPMLGVLLQNKAIGDDVLPHLKGLTDLTTVVIESPKVTADGLASLKELPPLEMLVLTNASDEQLAGMLGWKGPLFLQLMGDTVSDLGIAVVATMTDLQHLTLIQQTDPSKKPKRSITDAGIASLKSLKRLKRLMISDCPDVTGSGLGSLADLPNFEDLYFYTSGISRAGCAALARLPHLKTLNVDATNLVAADFASLSELKALEKLGVVNSKAFDDSAAAYLTNLSQLRELGIFDNNLTDAGLAHFAPLGSLRKLQFWKGKFTDAGLAHLRDLNDLRELSFESDIDVTDDGLTNLAGMTHLQVLKLPSKRITDDGLARLAKLTDLRTLGLSHAQIKGPSLQHLIGMKGLRVLDLGGTLVNDEGTVFLGKLSELQKLTLTSTKVSDAGLENLAGLKKLQTLHLEGTEVTDSGKKKLKKSLPSLSIDQQGNTFVGFDDADADAK